MKSQRPYREASFPHIVLPIVALVLGCTGGKAAAPANDVQDPVVRYHAPVPLGAETLRLVPVKRSFYVLASVENPTFEGLSVNRETGVVSLADGSPVRYYPPVLDVRVSAGTMERILLADQGYAVKVEQDMNDLLLGLQFKVKVFHGLHKTEIMPSSVRLIGMPADLPYEERVYRVSFEMPDVPIEDRLVIEVRSANGELLSRFHLDLL